MSGIIGRFDLLNMDYYIIGKSKTTRESCYCPISKEFLEDAPEYMAYVLTFMAEKVLQDTILNCHFRLFEPFLPIFPGDTIYDIISKSVSAPIILIAQKDL